MIKIRFSYIDGFYHCRSLDALFPSERNDPHDVLALQA